MVILDKNLTEKVLAEVGMNVVLVGSCDFASGPWWPTASRSSTGPGRITRTATSP